MEQKLEQILYEEYRKQNGHKLVLNKNTMHRIKEACKEAVYELNTKEQTEINLPFISSESGTVKHLVVDVITKDFIENYDFSIKKKIKQKDNSEIIFEKHKKQEKVKKKSFKHYIGAFFRFIGELGNGM